MKQHFDIILYGSQMISYLKEKGIHTALMPLGRLRAIEFSSHMVMNYSVMVAYPFSMIKHFAIRHVFKCNHKHSTLLLFPKDREEYEDMLASILDKKIAAFIL